VRSIEEVKRNVSSIVTAYDPTRMDIQGLGLQLIELIEQQEARISALEDEVAYFRAKADA
jgi:hypothetical protein